MILIIKYIAQNIKQYFRSSVLVFLLVVFLSFLFSLSSFLYSGILSSAKQSSRSKGDLIIGVNYDASDVDHVALNKVQKQELYSKWKSMVKVNWNAQNIIEGYEIPTELIISGSSNDLIISSYTTKSSQYLVSVSHGREPGENEILISDTFMGKINLGEGITAIYKDQNKIINSMVFTVSGFFMESEELQNLAMVSQDQLSSMDPGRLPDKMHIYLAPKNEYYPVLTSVQKDAYWDDIRSQFINFYRDDHFLEKSVNYFTSLDEFQFSKTIIDLFLVIITIFLGALGVVAAFSISNVNHMNITDRIKVIGTMFSFGLQKFNGAIILALEIGGLALFSTIIGTAFGIASGKYIGGIKLMSNSRTLSALLGGKSHLTLIFGFDSVVFTFFVCVGLPFLISLITIFKILQGPIVNQLRSGN